MASEADITAEPAKPKPMRGFLRGIDTRIEREDDRLLSDQPFLASIQSARTNIRAGKSVRLQDLPG